MPNLNAFGCAQLHNLDKFLASKRQLFAKYEEFFKGDFASILNEPSGCKQLLVTTMMLHQPDVKEDLLSSLMRLALCHALHGQEFLN